jgi:enterochelin esterase family protein
MTSTSVGPAVGATDVRFRLRLADDGVRAVRLCQDISRPRVGPPLRHGPSSTWECRIPRPPVDRLEYQFELEHLDGTREHILDPHNGQRAAGPFGEKSVVELPGYRPPAWLERAQPAGGCRTQIAVTSDVLNVRVDIGVWASPGLDIERPAPLLIVHDGPDYDRYSLLVRFLTAVIEAGRLPRLRVALLPAIDRNERYAACPNYARMLARELVPVLDWLAPQPPRRHDGRSWRVVMGTSLGALAALHAHRRYPDLFGGMFLQSGSFFQRHVDGRESGFARFDRIARFVSTVTEAATARQPIPVGMTCGTVEENLASNRRVRDALALQGYAVEFTEHRDAHNWVSWRDAFDPALVDVLSRSWR